MSKSVRIRTTPSQSDSYLKLKVEQDFDFIEILSLRISQAEAYTRFCSDYGVVVGRVSVNDGFGIPNAKVSIFIPLTDDDSEDSEISGLYPFKNIDDKDDNNIRYNLLPSSSNPDNTCFTPVGTFPTKREVIDNDGVLEIYSKYYKYTTSTNHAGDFMLFGIPTGNHTINIDVDLSDIGIASQRPYDYIEQGESEKRFDTTNKFKGDKDLDKLIQIKSFKKGVNVQPFWGDLDQCDIGITRLDFDVKKTITPSAIFMGSIFSDSEKNSINKNCRPRKDLGRLCEVESGEGTVEMIRKTIDGRVERFDVGGGRVINDSGSWAYQVPMNLDYKITDEFGNLVPSEDPSKGIPTRARVRFRISKDIAGSEGRLRTTAKYLVPHNPPNKTKIDYSFDENTSDEHFRDFHWNKIYTVSNYIPRVQAVCNGNNCADNRNMTGIKNVDNCVGDKTPFPYNRVDTDFNPLFTIMCIILSIIVTIVWMINSIIIAVINAVIKILNVVMKLICNVLFGFAKVVCGLIGGLTLGTFNSNNCKKNGCMTKDSGGYTNGSCNCADIVKPVPCIVLKCDSLGWAPGCNCSSGLNGTVGGPIPSNLETKNYGCWAATTDTDPKTINHWSSLMPNNASCGVGTYGGHSGHKTPGAGVTDCYAIQLASALNMFEFDFYNDWINGTLYSFLLKYKKKKSGKQKFCDVDCGNSESDNGCDKSFLVDTMVDKGNNKLANKKTVKESFKEGLIKQVTKTLPDGSKVETLYYAPYLSTVNHKLFATELVHLGSIFDCDWEGIPKLQPYLIPTTYKVPPYTDEYMDDNTTKITCGMTSTGINGTSGLFFDIDCTGLNVGELSSGLPRANNIKRICEFGVDIDQGQIDSNNNVTSQANCWINEEDIQQPYGPLFRNTFYQLNKNNGPTKLNSWPVGGLSPSINTGFGMSTNGETPLPTNYVNFRGGSGNAYLTKNVQNYTQTDNSFYFYFGIRPGITAVDIMNRKYFNECELVERNDFRISAIITDILGIGCFGAIDTTVSGGIAPYTYHWTGPNGYTNTETIGDITGLCGGDYTVTVIDSTGAKSTAIYNVNQPAPFTCEVVGVNAIQTGGNGDLNITVYGGTPNYTYSINGATPVSMGTSSFVTLQKPIGSYNVVVTEMGGLTCVKNNVLISEPAALTLSNLITVVHTTCGMSNGSLVINNTTSSSIGGVPPYMFTMYKGSTVVSENTMAFGLSSGTYTVTVEDNSPTPQIATQSVVINPSTPATVNIPDDIWHCWTTPSPIAVINTPITTTYNGGSYTITATPRDINNNPTTPIITQNFTHYYATLNGLLPTKYDFEIVDANGCTGYSYADFTPGNGQVPLKPMDMRWENNTEIFCWVNTNPNVTIQLKLIDIDGPFTISSPYLSTPYVSYGVANGTIITLPALLNPVVDVIMPFTIKETTHNCTKVTEIKLVSGVNVPPQQFKAIATQTTPNPCGGPGFLGEITVNASGGFPPYSYAWSPGSSTSQTITIGSGGCGTLFTCMVTDSKGCVATSNAILSTT